MIDGFVPFNSETCNLSLNKEEEEDADNAFPMQSILPLWNRFRCSARRVVPANFQCDSLQEKH